MVDYRVEVDWSGEDFTGTFAPVDTLASTGFDSNVSNGWQNTYEGLAWTLSGTAAGWSQASGIGLMSLDAVATERTATVPVTAADVNVVHQFQTPATATGAPINGYLLARRVDNSNQYLARLAFQTDGKLAVSIERFVAGVVTEIAPLTPTYIPYTPFIGYWLRFDVAGTMLRARVWRDGDPEPLEWAVRATDTTFASGLVGLRGRLSTGNTNTLPVLLRGGDFAARTLLEFSDVTDRTKDGLSIRYGRDTHRALAPLAPGTADFTLDNQSRDYLPDNADSPLYGVVLPGRRARVTAALPAVVGINVSASEYVGATFSNVNLGTYDSEYHFESQPSLTYLAGRGIPVFRAQFLWERLQPTPGGALSSTEMTRLQDYLTRCGVAGVPMIVCLRNFAEYTTSAGAIKLGSTSLPGSQLADVWSKLTAALQGHRWVYAYELLNEPNNIPPAPPNPVLTTWYTWEAAGVSGWVQDGTGYTLTRSTATFHDGVAALQVSKTLGSGAQEMLFNDAAQIAGDRSAFGTTFSTWALVPAGAPGTEWKAAIRVQDPAFTWYTGPEFVMTKGVWEQLTFQVAESLVANIRAIGVRFTVTNPNAATTVYIDQVQQGRGLSASRHWESISQQVVEAIRAAETGEHRRIIMPGYWWTEAASWQNTHPVPWVDDPAGNTVYGPHVYFDDNSGQYAQTYAQENTDAVGQGYIDVTDRARAKAANPIDWARQHGVGLFFTEVGWPDDADWNTVGAAVLDDLAAAKAGCAYWMAGEWRPDSEPLSAYYSAGAALDTPNSQAAVIEAARSYPFSLYAGYIDDLKVLPDISDQTVQVSCADPFGLLKGVAVSTELFRGLRSDEALHKLLDEVGWPQESRDIERGSSLFPQWWANGDAYDEAMKIVDSEGPTAVLTCDGDGNLVFRGRHHRLVRGASIYPQATWSGSAEPALSPPIGYDHGWRDIINTLMVEVPIRTFTTELAEVWKSEGVFSVPLGQTTTFTATSNDPFYDAVVPEEGVDYSLHAGAVTVSLSRTSGQSTVVSVTSTAGTATLSDIRLRAMPVPVARTVQVNVADSASVRKYGQKAWPNDRTPVWASVWDVQGIASAILGQRGERLPAVTARFTSGAGQMTARLEQQLARDFSDRVRIADDVSGVDFDFFVEQIQHTLSDLNHETVFGCEKAPVQVPDVFILGDASNGVLGTNRLGRRGIDDPARVFILGSAGNGVLGANLLAA